MDKEETAGVRIPPPIVYLACILIGVGLEYLWPVSILPSTFRYVVGCSVIILSVALFGLALREFLNSSTSIDHSKATTEIISSGPFGYSRNPVYLSMTMLSIGIAFASDGIWILAMTMPAVAITHTFVILKEEKYLERKFGDAYRQYKYSVRRWL